MYRLVIVCKDTTQPIDLLYRTLDRVESAYKNTYDIKKGAKANEMINERDDFGLEAAVHKDDVVYMVKVDLAKQQEIGMPRQPQKPIMEL